ncbi:MAG: hypothetical protein ACYDBQ_05445 [Thermoplasmatota archaeon]
MATATPMTGAERGGLRARLAHAVRGPRLQVVNLAVFYATITLGRNLRLLGIPAAHIPLAWLRDVARIDYPNPVTLILLSVAFAALLDASAIRARTGRWALPWGTVVATMGIWLMLDGHGWLPFLALPVLLVGSKQLIRTSRGHVWNANNFAACVLILAGSQAILGGRLESVVGSVTIGVNSWGANRASVLLMLLFGTVATLRARRFALAISYLAIGALVYAVVAWWGRYDEATWLMWAFKPVTVMIGFFAVTDPATSPTDRPTQVAYAALAALLAVPATILQHPDATVFALFLASPQRLWLQPSRAPVVSAAPDVHALEVKA